MMLLQVLVMLPSDEDGDNDEMEEDYDDDYDDGDDYDDDDDDVVCWLQCGDAAISIPGRCTRGPHIIPHDNQHNISSMIDNMMMMMIIKMIEL